MIKFKLDIVEATHADFDDCITLFDRVIKDTFKQEGFLDTHPDCLDEIDYKYTMLKDSLNGLNGSRFFLAKTDSQVVGTISCGPVNEDVILMTKGKLKGMIELGSMYILPDYQNKKIAQTLMIYGLNRLKEQSTETFCLDSGYIRAQQIFQHLIGSPYLVSEHYNGEDKAHMIFVAKTEEVLENLKQKG